jgi:ATP-dependent DNA ligase
MTFAEYIAKKQAALTDKSGAYEIKSDTRERWTNRILLRKLNEQGERGARQYLSDYGKGIAAPKCIQLALVAEAENCPDMAIGFWAKAYELETGNLAVSHSLEPRVAQHISAQPALPFAPHLPAHLQPGRIGTMQPIDAPLPREHYINDDDWYGQPKIDGNRLVVIGDGQIWYQSRSTKLREAPSQEIHQSLLDFMGYYGAFVLDGELYYQDANGGEHRTGAQAATANINAGKADAPVLATYAVFKALYIEGEDLTAADEHVRIEAAFKAFNLHWTEFPGLELLHTARTKKEKAELAEHQMLNGREGEIWIWKHAPYLGGKVNGNVRTKYLQEHVVEMTNLTPTTAEGRLFGAIEVASLDGKPMGSIGTGFSHQTAEEIQRSFEAGERVIEVVSQGLTENGMLWHGRFSKLLSTPKG